MVRAGFRGTSALRTTRPGVSRQGTQELDGKLLLISRRTTRPASCYSPLFHTPVTVILSTCSEPAAYRAVPSVVAYPRGIHSVSPYPVLGIVTSKRSKTD
jgi:hypothetical protein